MKVKSLPSVILFVCSIIIYFQSCHCLKCFQCESTVDNFVPTCLKIVNTEFLMDCKPGNVCSEARNNSVLFRGCESIEEVRAGFKIFSKPEDFIKNNRVSFSICNIDGCNDY